MDFLESLNLTLLEFEEKLRPVDIASRDFKHPFVFVIGAPRSGTTILTQVIAYLYDFGYINNIAARFWCAPVTGLSLSQAILGEESAPTFQSSYARTQAVGDIHEFGRFWTSHLGFPSPSDVDWIDLDAECQRVTRQALGSIQSFFGKPVVMKGIYPAYCHKNITELLDGNVIWINIERDPADACISIWKARQKRGKNKWFGWHIPKSDRVPLIDMSIDEQIAFQVLYFRKVYQEIATHTIQLEKLCYAPIHNLFNCIPTQYTQCRMLSKNALEYNTYTDQSHIDHFSRILRKVQDDYFGTV